MEFNLDVTSRLYEPKMYDEFKIGVLLGLHQFFGVRFIFATICSMCYNIMYKKSIFME